MRTRIKICCINSIDEAKLAIGAGADAIGLVGKMPSGPGPIPDSLIHEISKSVPPLVGTFLLTSETSAKGIIDHHLRTGTNTIQIVDLITEGTHEQIRAALPSVKIVQVIHVIDATSVNHAISVSASIDALLLDSGNPALAIKELGGTGRVHNWELSRQIREKSLCPVILAGGLNPENVKQAIQTVKPFAVDVCSGLRINGLLNHEKLTNFVRMVREADEY
jgi:phosphoribosylanthranilate isomerase